MRLYVCTIPAKHKAKISTELDCMWPDAVNVLTFRDVPDWKLLLAQLWSLGFDVDTTDMQDAEGHAA